MTTEEAIGFVAATLTATCWFPQAIRTIRTRDVAAISLTSQVVFALGLLAWTVYGVMIHSMPIIACQLVTLIPVLAIIAIKLHSFRRP
jgi:MtN3 and saliva related transmembrane protein